MAGFIFVWHKSSILYTKETIDVDVYRGECFQKWLLLLYQKHRIAPSFGPDLESAIYVKLKIEYFQENEVDLSENDVNPPNLPQFRPIMCKFKI